ncbi:MAG: iron-sulfur cluster assembly accessory protein [Chitinophagales bacterium]|nr:iron-sulfur cluster assembly accessory protein [Chitinophagales bacterium]
MDTKVLPIQLTDAALKEVLYLKQSSADFDGLRIGVEGGGCAGFSYVLKFDSILDNDNIYELDNLTIIINKAHELYLLDTVIDFKSGLDNRGFIYENPNAKETCGCGTSFSA